MSKEIYTYVDLEKLNKNPFMDQLKKYPIITVTSDLKKALIGRMEYDRVEGLFADDKDVLVTDFRTIAKMIDSEWNTEQSKFYETVLISEFVSKKLDEAKESDRNWLSGCLRNIASIQSAITLLEQAEVSPKDLANENSCNIKLFVEIWDYLRKKDPLLDKFHTKMDQLSCRNSWIKVLEETFLYEKNLNECDSIIFLGFYYFTPLQKRVMNLLEKAGFNLIYLIPYDEKYPFVYEIWNRTYSETKGFSSITDWHIEKSISNNAYGEILENGQSVIIKNNLKIKEYASVIEFVDDVKAIRKQNYSVYSANYKLANEILRDYFPEEYGERKVLSYPVGVFVSTINRLWDEEKQSVVLDEERLIECFSSGWLSYNGISGRQYLEDLINILPFFSGCLTINEWKKRIEQLKQIHQEVISPFIKNIDADETIGRWQETMGNPLSSFSMFSVETHKLDIILALIKQLLDMATELFGNNNQINISEHIYKLGSVLNRYEISNEMYDEERKIVTDILEKLGSGNTYTEKCAPSDIARALNLYISGRLEDDEIMNNQMGLIYPIYNIDAASVKNKSKVHICLCDVRSMPGDNKEYIWPLTKDIMERCLEETHNSLISNIMDIMSSTIYTNRYFIYRALNNSDVTLSWIRKIDDKLLAPSPYIKLIVDASNIEIEPSKRKSITYSNISETQYGRGRVASYEKESYIDSIAREAKMSYALCPIQYVFSYVVDKYPSFQSDFQQNYAINALISAIYSLMKEDNVSLTDVYNNVIDLFPKLRKAEKRQVKDYLAYDYSSEEVKYTNKSECGDQYYTDERLKILYPNRPVRDVANYRFSKLLTPDGRDGMNLYEVMEATDNEEMKAQTDIVKSACVFCPHIDYCRNAVYAVDQENYYD